MEKVHRIDQELTKLFHDFDEVARSLEFHSPLNLLEVDLKALRIPGLYFIEVWSNPYGASKLEDWLSSFKAAWDREEFKKSFVPSCQRGRMAKHSELREWMPLYLGKSERIGNRLWEHIYLAKDKRTFALKLEARNLLQGNQFRVSLLPLPVDNYAVLAPMLEASLRHKHLPLVGRQ